MAAMLCFSECWRSGEKVWCYRSHLLKKDFCRWGRMLKKLKKLFSAPATGHNLSVSRPSSSVHSSAAHSSSSSSSAYFSYFSVPFELELNYYCPCALVPSTSAPHCPHCCCWPDPEGSDKAAHVCKKEKKKCTHVLTSCVDSDFLLPAQGRWQKSHACVF